jgi:hypothetical protein
MIFHTSQPDRDLLDDLDRRPRHPGRHGVQRQDADTQLGAQAYVEREGRAGRLLPGAALGLRRSRSAQFGVTSWHSLAARRRTAKQRASR